MGFFLFCMMIVVWFLYDTSVSGEDKMITRELWEELKKWFSKKINFESLIDKGKAKK